VGHAGERKLVQSPSVQDVACLLAAKLALQYNFVLEVYSPDRLWASTGSDPLTKVTTAR